MDNCEQGKDVLGRCGTNPLIVIDDMPFRCADIWNAAVAKVDDGYLLLITVETLEGQYCIVRARSEDGLSFEIDPRPLVSQQLSSPNAMYESGGIRDPRITRVNGWYYVTYTADGDHGLRIGLLKTEDFEDFQWLAYVSQVDVKNGAMFPRQIDGHYTMLKRPDAGWSIWLSHSDDLTFWGREQCVMTPRGGHWDAHRIGPAGPPIEIDEGWLLLYYGEKSTSAGPLVRLGAAILDRQRPWLVTGRSNIPILTPRERYERIGDVPNVVFSCGALLEGDELIVYYGASDSCICRGTARLADVVATCHESEREF